jgi:murein DD-endopeptidase MepM/ murein hydrolase activator NlpD
LKPLGCLFAVLLGFAGIAMFFAWLSIYVVESALASEYTRISPVMPGGMSQVVGDRMAAWTVGNREPDKLYFWVPPPEANEEPDDYADHVDAGGIFTGTVPERTDCKQPYGWPIDGWVSQEFSGQHSGIDIVGPYGGPVMTTMCGTVRVAGWSNVGYGNLVVVENGEYKTYYTHLAEFYVGPGQEVEIGEAIGAEGSTGNSTGPHVHYEVRVNNVCQNPRAYMD